MNDHTTHQSAKETPYGYCHCGCGQPAPIASQNNAEYHHIKGEPIRFIRGHNGRRPLLERFWEKVDKRGPDECWEWQAATSSFGYGQIQRGGRGAGHMPAHRLSYELHHGAIPAGMEVCHACDNPPCVNPNHLWLGTHQDNLQDCASKGRNFTTGRERPRGESNGQAKLTAEQVIAIRELCDARIPRREIAEQFGVAKSTVTAIFLRVNWKHI